MKKPSIDVTKYLLQNTLQSPMKIALISDIHNQLRDDLIPLISSYNPDLITIPGDLVDESDQKLKSSVILFLEKCVSIAPTFYSLGNHEWILSDAEISNIKKLGVFVLDNDYITFSNKNQTVLIGGLTSATVIRYKEYYKLHPELKDVSQNKYPDWNMPDYVIISQMPYLPDYTWLDSFEKQPGFKILLCHHPESWALSPPLLYKRNIDLVLSGHSHGGQIRVLDRGLYAPGQGILPKYTSGIHCGHLGHLVISRGLTNTSLVPRINNPPELVLVSLV